MDVLGEQITMLESLSVQFPTSPIQQVITVYIVDKNLHSKADASVAYVTDNETRMILYHSAVQR